MAIDELEERLERELEALDEQADDVSKAINDDDPPEGKQDPEVDVEKSADDAGTVKEPDETPDDQTDQQADETESKDDDASDTKAENDPDPVVEDQPTVPISRLSEVTREKRKLERAGREKDDKIREFEQQLADKESLIESLQAQAQVQGIELHNVNKGFTEEDRESLTEEFGAAHAARMINMQKQIDQSNELLKQFQANAQPKSDDDPVMLAIEENDDAHGWFLAGGKNWETMKSVWAENEDSLYRDFKTDAERIKHVVKLVKGVDKPKESAKPAEKKGPARSLSNVPGDPGTGGDKVDQVMAMGARATDYMADLETKNPSEYEAIMDGLRERRLNTG